MAYDEALATRVRTFLASEDAIDERRMMGSLVFLKNGNMLGGVNRAGLLVRVGAEGYDESLAQPHVRPMDFGDGRRPKGLVVVAPEGVTDDADLHRWVGTGLAFAAKLPPKPGLG
ncbi:MAG TPA: TfoX/Sxy family protein [Acidimicrobiales bacterium]